MAPEAANNAVTGSAMIPLLTLGIPGDDVTAVLMGAFLIQGITPGPNIFFENTTVVYGIFGSLIMCDILLYVIAKLGFRVWVRITQLPKHIIFSTVTIFAFVGTYSINQNLFDILLPHPVRHPRLRDAPVPVPGRANDHRLHPRASAGVRL